jgi:glycine hydroxymethyltransferase
MSGLLKKADRAVFDVLAGEKKRQNEGLELIASENYVSPAVLEALGSVLTNKYAEGYPGKRYYGGQEYTDAIERLAIARAIKLFGAEHANVQPLSGAAANLAVYAALLAPGETVLGMDLSHGGHLTHGHPVTLPAKVYRFVRYKTEPDGLIDYGKLERLAEEIRPKILLAGFSSYTRALDYTRFAAIAKKVGAVAMMDMAHIAGLVAGGALPSPVPYFDIVTATTHKTLRGPRGGLILCREQYAAPIDKAVFPGVQGGPHMHSVAAKAVAFGEALQPAFRKYAQAVIRNAAVLAEELTKRGAHLLFGGTENHMLLIDVVASYGLSGREAQILLDAVGIATNKNVIPDDPRGPIDPSGLRIGTPAATTRGLGKREMRALARMIDAVLCGRGDDAVIRKVRAEVAEVCRRFPVNRS